MEITEVRIFPRESEDRKLKAYATITIDNSFVVRNVKIIDGTRGLFVAMPSRKLREACPKCGYKNAVRSRFCNQCGGALPQTESSASPSFPKLSSASLGFAERRAPRSERRVENSDENGRQSGHRDIAHPITSECREYIQNKVLEAYMAEIKSPRSATAENYESVKAKKEIPKENIKYESPVPKINTHQEDDFEGDLEL